MSVLEDRSCGHWCEAPCTAKTCDCPPCDCADCKRRRYRAETSATFTLVRPTQRQPVQLALDFR